MNPAKILIDRLQMQPLIEGGYYRETYKSNTPIKVGDHSRLINSAIYYLLESNDFSCWHRLKSDEIWHYYCGSALTLYEIDTTTKQLSQTLLGNPLELTHARPQHLVPAETWFAACVNAPDSFTLLGCTVAPGFDFADYEIGKRHELLKHYPQHDKIIRQFTREETGIFP